MEKREMRPGQKYRGYGILNEYGEFEFIPEDTGSRKEAVKLLKQGDGYTVSYSKRSVIIHIKLSRKLKWPGEMLNEFVTKFNNIFKVVKTHEM